MAGDGQAVVVAAGKYAGVPWVFGGHDPKKGLDCVGLVVKAFHDTGDGALVGNSYTVTALVAQHKGPKYKGSSVVAHVGDLIVYGPNEHVAIYMGGGQIISALGGMPPDTKKPGVSVCGVHAMLGTNGKTMPITAVLYMQLAQPAGGGGIDLNPLDMIGNAIGGVAALPGNVTADAVNASANIFGDMFAWLPQFAANGAVLVLIVYLAVGGIRQLVDESS